MNSRPDRRAGARVDGKGSKSPAAPHAVGAGEKTRAQALPGDERARFTLVMSGSAAGIMLPSMAIIKCTVDQPDLRSTTVLSTLMKKSEINAGSGWEEKVWRKHLVKTPGTEPVEHIRPYLYQASTGDVITCQKKAYNCHAG